MIDDVAEARETASRFSLLAADHPLLAPELGPLSADTPLPAWPITSVLQAWLSTLDCDRDVEGVLLKIAAARTGLDVGLQKFDATVLRRKKKIPITTFAEMLGME